MGNMKSPWLAEAEERLRHYHVEIDAAMRRLAWGAQLSPDHVAALIDAMCKAHKIEAAVIRHLSDKGQRLLQLNTNALTQRSSADTERTASHNGKGHNGIGPVILKH